MRIHSESELSKENWKICRNFLRVHSGSELFKKNWKIFGESTVDQNYLRRVGKLGIF